MSLWTDRELKLLIARVNELDAKVVRLENKLREIAVSEHIVEPAGGVTPPFDKRTREFKQWKSTNPARDAS
jgi:hypothetical protein